MANQTVTTMVNHDDDSVLGLANGENYAIDGGRVLVNCDTRWGQNDCVIGAVTISSTEGGKFELDGRDVWEIAFDASTGNVPALASLGSNGVSGGSSLATGELFRVWATGEFAPRAAGGAMPTSGWIKLRSKTGTFLNDEIITLPGGATITVNSVTGGKRSWIHVVGERANTIAVPRLGSFEARGDWYYLADADGSDNQQIPIPVLDEIPVIWVETSPGSNEYEKYQNGGNRWNGTHGAAMSFISTDVRGKFFGQYWRRSDCATTSGSNVITCGDTTGLVPGMPIRASAGFTTNSMLYVMDVTGPTTFTVAANSNDTGTNRIFNGRPPVLELAHRATYDCGFKPASGCKIRIPNVFISTSHAGVAGTGQWQGQAVDEAAADRWDLTTNAAGAVLLDTVSSTAILSTTNAFSVDMRRCGLSLTVAHANTAGEPYLEDCAIGLSGETASTAFSFTNQFTGVTLKNCKGVRYSDDNNTAIYFSDCANVTLEDTIGIIFGSTTALTRSNSNPKSLFIQRCFDVNVTNYIGIGSGVQTAQVTRANFLNTQYADLLNSFTTTTGPVSAFAITSTSSDIFIDGFSSFGNLERVHPYTAILLLSGSASGIEFRNLGTAAAPYDMGSSNGCAHIVSASVVLNVTLRRLYSYRPRTTAVTLANTVQNVIIDNVWADDDDVQAIAASACLCRGCRWTNSTTGQTAVYGRHWEDAFTSETAGRLLIACNEALESTEDQVTIDVGTGSGFTSAGGLSMAISGDNAIWEMPYFALGHTAFANAEPTITGANTSNHTFEFQYDLGSGYNGNWLPLTGAELSGIGAINPATGFRLKVSATVNTASNTNRLSYIRMDTVTDATSQQIAYPFPVATNHGIITNIEVGSRVQVYNVTTDSEIYNETVADSSVDISYVEGVEFTTGDLVRIRITYQNGLDAKQKFSVISVAGPTGWGVFADQTDCPVYAVYGIDGSTVTEYIWDGTNIEIDLDVDDNLFYISRLFAWDKYFTTTEVGIRDAFNAVRAIDAGNIQLTDVLIDNIGSQTAAQADAIRIFRSDMLLPVTNPTSGGGGLSFFSTGTIYTISTGGSALTPTESAHLLGLDTDLIPSIKNNTDLIPATL
jgi:hypothetical protein